MNKKEITKKLKDAWIKPCKDWRVYEKAKKLICPEDDFILPSEYEYRITVIEGYLWGRVTEVRNNFEWE